MSTLATYVCDNVLYINIEYTIHGKRLTVRCRYMISCGNKDGDIRLPYSVAYNLVDLGIPWKVLLQYAVPSYH